MHRKMCQNVKTRELSLFDTSLFKYFLPKRRNLTSKLMSSSSEVPQWKEMLSPLHRVALMPSQDPLSGADSNKRESSLPDFLMRESKAPSVTQVLKDSMSYEDAARLHRWRKSKIKELGMRGFEQLNRETLDRGTSFHTLIHDYLQFRDHPETRGKKITEKSLRLFDSAFAELQKIDHFVTGEIFSTHPNLYYRGKIDSLVMIEDELTLVEWKTSAKSKPTLASTYDAPIQAAAYVGAINRDPGLDLVLPSLTLPSSTSPSLPSVDSSSPRLTSLPSLLPPSVSAALIVVCYEDGSAATAHKLDLDELNNQWRLWRDRLFTYWLKNLAARGQDVEFMSKE